MQRPVTVNYDQLTTPIGPLILIFANEDLIRIDFGSFEENELKINKYLKRARFMSKITRAKIDHPLKEELKAYFKKQLTNFTPPKKMYGTDFQRDVWQALLKIPFGQTMTYKEVAEKIGRPKAVRAVGGALNKNPFSIVYPCHRVIGSDGSLTGFGGGVDRKQYLLELERGAL